MGVKDTDHGFAALRKRLREEDWSITVGVHQSAGEHKDKDGKPGGMTVADIATIHEFGAPAANIPARSFIGAWFDEHGKELGKKSLPDIKSFLAGRMTKEQVLARAGARAVGGIQKRMAQNIPPPLKPATIARKGSSVALIDTGQLRQSVTWAPGKAKE